MESVKPLLYADPGILHQHSLHPSPHIITHKTSTHTAQNSSQLPTQRTIPFPPLPTNLIRTARFPRTQYQAHDMVHALAVLDLGEDCWAAVSGAGVSC